MVKDEVAFLCLAGIVSDGWNYQALPAFVASERPDAWTGLHASPWRLRLTDGARTLGHALLGFQPFRGCGPRGAVSDGLVLGALRLDDRIRGIEVIGEAGVVHQFELHRKPPLLEDVRAVVERDTVEVSWTARSAGQIWAQVRLGPNHERSGVPIPSPLLWSRTERISLPISNLPPGSEVRARVWVSDGSRSSTALSEPVLLPKTGRRIALISKPRGEVPFGQPITIHALTTDGEGPSLPNGLQWVINGEPYADRRTKLPLRDLPPGSHLVELRTNAEVLSSCTVAIAAPTDDQEAAATAWRRHDTRHPPPTGASRDHQGRS